MQAKCRRKEGRILDCRALWCPVGVRRVGGSEMQSPSSSFEAELLQEKLLMGCQKATKSFALTARRHMVCAVQLLMLPVQESEKRVKAVTISSVQTADRGYLLSGTACQ